LNDVKGNSQAADGETSRDNVTSQAADGETSRDNVTDNMTVIISSEYLYCSMNLQMTNCNKKQWQIVC